MPEETNFDTIYSRVLKPHKPDGEPNVQLLHVDKFKEMLFTIGGVLTLGALSLVSRWFPQLWIKFCGTVIPQSINNAIPLSSAVPTHIAIRY